MKPYNPELYSQIYVLLPVEPLNYTLVNKGFIKVESTNNRNGLWQQLFALKLSTRIGLRACVHHVHHVWDSQHR